MAVESVITPLARWSFVKVFTPELDRKGKLKYTIAFLFLPGADLSALKANAKAAADERWGDKKPNNLKLPFLDAGNYDYKGYEKGMTLIRCSSVQKPGIVDGRNQPITDPAAVYSGCWGYGQVRAFAYDVEGNRGVAFGIQNLQKVKDDEPLGGAMPAEKAFAPIEGAEAGASSDDIFDGV